MEREWLERELAAGRSIESLAREAGKSPSTVAYWVNKFGLASAHAERHAAKGPIDRDGLAALVARGLSTRAVASELGRSQASVRHWLGRYGLRTERCGPPEGATSLLRTCGVHGRTTFVRYGTNDSFRCERCRKERVVARRKRVKEILVAEAGGACVVCGYDRHITALHFHHVDPATKSFGIARHGIARSLARSRAEAAKCVLLCANCHAEVEAGAAEVPYVPLAGRSMTMRGAGADGAG